MKKITPLSFLCTMLFLTGILAAFFGFINRGSLLLQYTLMIISVLYLITGWFIFKGYHPSGHPLLLFLIGYLYSSVFMSFAFVTAAWPLAKTFIAISIPWSVIQIIMVTFIRKKLSRDAFVQFLIEGCLMLIMTIAGILHTI